MYSDRLHINILPVNFISFTATKEKISALLTWQTASEINTDYFNIRGSRDGVHFSTINKLPAAGTSNSLKLIYSDRNITALNTGTIYYRIQEVDKDGRGTYSSIQAIKITNNNLFSVSPNPVENFINIVASNNVDDVQIRITDINGKILYTTKQNFLAGQQITIPVSKFQKEF